MEASGSNPDWSKFAEVIEFKNKLFKGIPDNSYFYFVNSYYCNPSDKGIVVATTEYGEEFASIVAYRNIVATQFHPEKSGKAGFQLLRNWYEYYVD